MRRKKGVVTQGLQLSVAMGVSQLTTAFTYAISARHSSPSTFGSIVVVLSVAAVFAGVVDYGQSTLLVREVAAGRVTVSQMYRLLAAKIAAVGSALLLVVLPIHLLLALAGILDSKTFWAYPVALGSILLQAQQVPLRAGFESGKFALALVADKALCLAFVATATVINMDASDSLLVGIVVGLVADIALCATFAFRSDHLRPGSLSALSAGPPSAWMAAWRGSSGYGSAAVLSSMQQLDTVFVGLAAGPNSAGVYGAVSRWTNPLLLPASALAQTGAPYAAAASTTAESVRRTARSCWILLPGLIACVLVALLAPYVTPVILGTQYAASSAVLTILALAAIPSLLNQPIAMILQSRQYEKAVSYVFFAGLAARLSIAYGISLFAAGLGAAYGVFVQQALLLVGLAVLLRRALRLETGESSKEGISS